MGVTMGVTENGLLYLQLSHIHKKAMKTVHLRTSKNINVHTCVPWHARGQGFNSPQLHVQSPRSQAWDFLFGAGLFEQSIEVEQTT